MFLCWQRGAAPKVFIDYLVKVALPSLGSLPEDVQLMAAKGLALLVHPLVMKQEDIQALCEPALEGLMVCIHVMLSPFLLFSCSAGAAEVYACIGECWW